jgi:hypothetical protein
VGHQAMQAAPQKKFMCLLREEKYSYNGGVGLVRQEHVQTVLARTKAPAGCSARARASLEAANWPFRWRIRRRSRGNSASHEAAVQEPVRRPCSFPFGGDAGSRQPCDSRSGGGVGPVPATTCG